MRFNFRVDHKNAVHVKATVFVDGRNCGGITVSADEFKALVVCLQDGAEHGDFDVRVEVNGMGIYETECPIWKDGW